MEQAESAFMAQLLSPRATFLDLQIDPDYQIVPQVRAGKLLHDADPALPQEELARIMA
jgi:hypothetical protein